MNGKQIRKVYEMNANVSRVWEALTTPEIIQEYFFCTDVTSEWKKGSRIIFRGTWEGKSYEDKGLILDIIPEKLMTVSYWSNLSGKPDTPENYTTYSYILDSFDENKTRLTLVQEDKFASEEARRNAWMHWDTVMAGMKKMVEDKNEKMFLH